MKQIIVLIIAFTCKTFAANPRIEPLIDVDKDIKIELYTQNNPIEPQILEINNINSIKKSNYKPEIPTRIFVHGFQSHGGLKNTLTDAYFVQAEHNVNLIQMNWEKASITINYPGARQSVGMIGQYTAKFIDFMVENNMLDLSKLSIIGHSLGAHVAGFTGKNLRTGKLPKIVGLDPAQVLFSIDKPDERLNSTDAAYVETIQTSILGFFEPIGTVSFYPNGGRVQPGCSWDRTGQCAHSTSYKYFGISVMTDVPLVGDRCNSLDEVKQATCKSRPQATMGGEPGAIQQDAGIYYIRLVADPDKTVFFG